MKFRNPDEKGKNILRLLPVMFFLIGIPIVGNVIYQYFTGAEDDVVRVVIAVIILAYFGFRSKFALEWTFVQDEEDQ